ncbi:MAG TPA: hypothetical protein VK446_14650 [Methylocystis sp.]|nr:hypothetical protein [Methylocystis sp.]
MSTLAKKNLLSTAIVTTLLTLPGIASAETFFKLDNPHDLAFNQLLGVNDGRIIVGYYGDGVEVANVGYTLVPTDHYSIEFFSALPKPLTVTQLQAIGINNLTTPAIVGFVTDSNNNTHGFIDYQGIQAVVDDPKGVFPTNSTQNLLGVNDLGQAAGFYLDANGNSHGFVVSFSFDLVNHKLTQQFSSVNYPGATATQASAINNEGVVYGFFIANGVSHGFLEKGGAFTPVDVKLAGVNVTGTTILGANNKGEFVGTYTAGSGNATTTHGFIYDGTTFLNVDAPGSSQTTVFTNVQGTTVNGINDAGDIVGFYSDGLYVDGFVIFK